MLNLCFKDGMCMIAICYMLFSVQCLHCPLVPSYTLLYQFESLVKVALDKNIFVEQTREKLVENICRILLYLIDIFYIYDF